MLGLLRPHSSSNRSIAFCVHDWLVFTLHLTYWVPSYGGSAAVGSGSWVEIAKDMVGVLVELLESLAVISRVLLHLLEDIRYNLHQTSLSRALINLVRRCDVDVVQ